MLGTACSTLVGETPTETATVSAEADDTSTETRTCPITTGRNEPVDTGSLATDALFMSGELFVCSADVVVVGSDDLNDVSVAAQLAAALQAPLLFPEARLAAEIGRLRPSRVHLIGGVEASTPPDAETVTHDVTSAIQATREVLQTSQESTAPLSPDSSTIIDTVTAIQSRDRVVTPSIPPSTTVTAADPVIATGEIVAGLARSTPSEMVWIVDAADPLRVLLSSALGNTAQATTIAIDGTDILGYPQVGEVLKGKAPGDIRFVGPIPVGREWELTVLRGGAQLPGGGFHVLPADNKRRYVAFYGHPETTALGALGEQDPIATLERMQPFLDAYTADGSQTIPTFEMIASVASAGPTDDGDYSFEWPISTFDEWIDVARDNEVYVVLDLQSGREDFLSQAMFYEELLKLPFVGLALDPEWRLAPHQVHLEQVGRVEATEVNQVIDWLADLVRNNGLPQKLLIVHQFRPTMIQNRELLEQRPELQLIIQMDGDGTEEQKDGTFSRLRAGAEDAFWSWGWKNFFDEDEPGPPSPEATMGKVPSPVYVSYQ